MYNPATGQQEMVPVSKLKLQPVEGGACRADIAGEMKLPIALPFGKTFLLLLRDPDHTTAIEPATGRKFHDEV